ncbi:transcription factor IBH1-like 1 [Populus alba x Populus x berolinensis]|nr:transcription factor IBH1-like 1 [Populus alba x Populus x berolinensis]
MCLHVLCLSLLKAHCCFSFEQINGVASLSSSFTFFFLLILSLLHHSRILRHTFLDRRIASFCNLSYLILMIFCALVLYNKGRMRDPSSLKQQFLKKWILGLQVCGSGKQNMSILERKKAIQLSADIALASTRDGRTCWSRALIANASKHDDNKILVQHMLATENERLKKASIGLVMDNKMVRCKKILKRSCCIKRVRKSEPQVVLAKSIAKRMVNRRAQVLKSLLPGGEFMDDISLIEETLDYIESLRAQVDVMRTLAKATELVNDK